MYFTPTKKYNIINVDDYYATLTGISENDFLDFEFSYKASVKDVMRYDAYQVTITVFSNQVSNSNYTQSSIGSIFYKDSKNVSISGISSPNKFGASLIDKVNLAENILLNVSNAKGAATYVKSNIIATKVSDITSKINNNLISDLKSINNVSEITGLYKQNLKTVAVNDLKKNDKNYQKLDKVDASIKKNSVSSVKEESLSLIKMGIDPSKITKSKTKIISSYENFQGVNNKANKNNLAASKFENLSDNITSKLNNSSQNFSDNIFDLNGNDQKYTTVISNDPVEFYDLKANITFLKPKVTSSLHVEFEIKNNKTGEILQTITKDLDVQKHINFFTVPTTPPKISITKSGYGSFSVLEICQVDKLANKVNIYKKNIYTSSPKIESYVLVATRNLKLGERIKYVMNVSSEFDQIYRVVPVYNDFIGQVFSNVVQIAKKKRKQNFASITAKNVNKGIKIEVGNLPEGITSFQLMKKNLTANDKIYTSQGPIIPVKVLSFNKKTLENSITNARQKNFSVIDSSVVDGNIYEYVAKLQYMNGSQVMAGSEIIECLNQQEGKVSIDTSGLEIDSNNNDVRFNVDVQIADGELDHIDTLVKELGYGDYFSNDVQKQKEQLKNLLAYSVERVNLNTGDREKMGTYSNKQFSDSTGVSVSNCKKLEAGNSYRYIVTALIRKPETVFEKFQKTEIDIETKKQYKYTPNTFKHPISLKTGTLVTNSTMKKNYAKDILEHGQIGCTVIVEVSIPLQKSSIENIKVNRFDKRKNIISCMLSGNESDFDHFIVSKNVNGVSNIIGSFHSISKSNEIFWIHELEKGDLGYTSYSIIPVYNDYSHGQLKNSNSIMVENV